MRRYGLLPLCLVAYVLLAGCATNTLDAIAKNTACTTRVSGEVSFGSITPTGKAKWSAVCKPLDTSPPVASVPEVTAADLLK